MPSQIVVAKLVSKKKHKLLFFEFFPCQIGSLVLTKAVPKNSYMLLSAWKSEDKTRPRAGSLNPRLPNIGNLHGIGRPMKLMISWGIPMFRYVLWRCGAEV